MMDQPVTKVLRLAFYTFAFILAVFYGSSLFHDVAKSLNQTADFIRMTDPNVVQNVPIDATKEYSGAEVLQTVRMIDDLGVTVVVDGTVFQPDEGIPQTNFDPSVIEVNKHYQVTFLRNVNGDVVRIVFKSH